RTLAHCGVGEENFTLEADNRATFWKVNGESYAADYCEIAQKSEGEEEAPAVAESSEWKPSRRTAGTLSLSLQAASMRLMR
ncbi:MAG: hypothetical protein KIG56_05850, partial [Bacteroidales bacterium]|nr:hypothetical protein [Bacteroidales bacterium]